MQIVQQLTSQELIDADGRDQFTDVMSDVQ